METRSKFSVKTVYIPLVLALLVFACGIWLGMHPELKLKTGVFGKHNAEVGALGLTFLGLLWVWLLIRKAKRITLTANDITLQSLFGKRIITKTEIVSIDLLAREDGGFTSSNKRVSGTLFMLNDFDKIFIAERYYSNYSELKDALKANFANLVIAGNAVKNVQDSFISSYSNTAEKFSGNALFTFNTMFLIMFSVGLFSTPYLAKTGNINVAFFFLFFVISVIFFLLSGMQMNYFIIMNNRLVIKNHFWPWRNIEYDINDIEQVIAESNWRVSNDLRINFKSNPTKTYGAGSLRDKTWRALIERFSALGVSAVCET